MPGVCRPVIAPRERVSRQGPRTHTGRMTVCAFCAVPDAGRPALRGIHTNGLVGVPPYPFNLCSFFCAGHGRPALLCVWRAPCAADPRAGTDADPARAPGRGTGRDLSPQVRLAGLV